MYLNELRGADLHRGDLAAAERFRLRRVFVLQRRAAGLDRAIRRWQARARQASASARPAVFAATR